MKISIEFKNNKYTITYGKLQATGATLREAKENLIKAFGLQVDRFFVA